MASQLPNYLRAHRKRLGLSQEDVAFLLGAESGAKACRYERFVRQPGLETALAYEAIFQRRTSELFAGLYQNIQQAIVTRAKTLARRTARKKSNGVTAHKLQALTDIAAIKINNKKSVPHEKK